MSTIGNWVDAATADSELAHQVSEIHVTGATEIKTQDKESASSGPTTAGTPVSDEKELSLEEKSYLQKILRRGLLDTKSNVEIQQKNPNSILHSSKSFEELNLRAELLKGIYAMGFNAPSRIQESALPYLLANPPQNLIAQSQSGTGKTAAFVLAMLSRVDASKNYPQAICLSPTYELALQTGEVVKQMGKFCPEITTIFAVKGSNDPVPRGQKLTDHIVIGTPGKMTDWAFRLKFLDLNNIKVFVLDEADVMIATQGYQDSSIKIHRKLPQTCQMMLFSATYNPEVMNFAESLIPDATIFRLTREEESLDNIKQYYITCKDQDEKYQAITNIYGVISIGQAMIFCQTRKAASWLATHLSRDGHAVALLSGDLDIGQRLSVLNRFRDGKEKILITTNVMARGIDIDQVTLVINYDLPMDLEGRPDCETYLHRIGRTGRFGKAGLAINLIDSQQCYNSLKVIERHFGRPVIPLDHNDVLALEELEN